MNDQPNPGTQLKTIRLIWFALLFGQLAFFVATLFAGPKMQGEKPPQDTLDKLFTVNIVMLCTMVPLGFLIRKRIFRNARGENPNADIPIQAYQIGNILFWAMCEGTSFLGLVIIFMNHGWLWPYFLVPAIAMTVQALAFPTGAGISEQ